MTELGDLHAASGLDAADGRLYSSHEAAEFLGIHRSTLHLAMRKRKLTPDSFTPGGHARFYYETLRQFRDRLALDSATGGDGGIARALSAAVASLSRITDLEPVCEAVVDAALAACPGFAACLALACRDGVLREPFDLIASRGVQDRLMLEYRWLRRSPGMDFISSLVARQGARALVSDALSAGAALPEGTQRLMRGSGWRSVALLPCVSNGETLGLLICLGRTACSSSEPEIAALEQLADVMTVALWRWRRDTATRRQTEAIRALILQARASVGRAPREDDLAALRRICQQGAQARVVCEWGFPAATEAEAPEPLADLLRVAATDGAEQRAEWVGADGAAIALATPAPTDDGRAAVGAIWRKEDMRSGIELALLQVYAQSCASVVYR
ncbi:MAG: GAF domain-containing protein [Chloroflexota bacterium]|nr:GAF domain-containing protein [Chloroflexota bacterium]